MRSLCAPYQSPIDVLRCTLEEIWPAGAVLESFHGQKMFVGLSRVVEPGVTFLAHHDIAAKDAPTSWAAKSLLAQFAANIYLTMPDDGRELQMWHDEIDGAVFDGMRGESYGIEPQILGRSQLRIKPQPGDLIIFNSRKMHSVVAGAPTARISLACFIGYRGMHAPLTYWS